MGPYAGFGWRLVGGHLALDLLNTVSWQHSPDRITDRLIDTARLADWLAVAAPAHRERSTVTPLDLRGPGGSRALAAVRALRLAGSAALAAHVAAEPAEVWAVQAIRDSYHRALVAAAVEPGLPLRPRVVVDSADQIEHLLGLALGELCRRDDLDRLRRCADRDCGWFYLDASRNRSRRWCDPEDCGNRNRVRAFAARAQARSLSSTGRLR